MTRLWHINRNNECMKVSTALWFCRIFNYEHAHHLTFFCIMLQRGLWKIWSWGVSCALCFLRYSWMCWLTFRIDMMSFYNPYIIWDAHCACTFTSLWRIHYWTRASFKKGSRCVWFQVIDLGEFAIYLCFLLLRYCHVVRVKMTSMIGALQLEVELFLLCFYLLSALCLMFMFV
jgi:hypothetical protein